MSLVAAEVPRASPGDCDASALVLTRRARSGPAPRSAPRSTCKPLGEEQAAADLLRTRPEPGEEHRRRG
ncbi:Protein FAM220A [Frankliniella fusca]|uniref:Protein FAM220A n=1 Tax=Frankliniella fusca TaxID=407009 RepID=A0AAE1GX59_9NEOP|nr:Protein FAM220A [Frankliniella fusca]